MSSNDAETPKASPVAQPSLKVVTILAAGALVLSLVNTVLLVLNPTASNVEQANTELKSDVAESIGSLDKKLDGLRSAEVEWQSVLKKSSDKPDAVYKIVRTPDGLLTLTEIAPAPAATEEAPAEGKK